MKTRRRRIGIEILFERTEERDGVRETRPVVTAAFPDPFFFPFLFSLLLLLLFFVCLHFQLLAVESTVREAWDLILCIYIFISICGDSGDIIIRGRWTLLIVFVSYLSLFFFFPSPIFLFI